MMNIDEMIADAQAEEMVNARTMPTFKEPERTVEIPLDEYVRLNLAAYDLELLVKTLLNDAKMNYSDKGLSFDEEKVDTVIKLIEPEGYLETMARLPFHHKDGE